MNAEDCKDNERLAAVALQRLVRSREIEIVKRPTSEGWWWTRPDDGCLWRIVEVTMIDGKPWIQEPGDEHPDTPIDIITWWDWVGPLMPPSTPNDQAH